MAPLPTNASDGLPSESASQPSHHHRAKSASQEQCDEARMIFNKTIEGHYRHGKTGYKQVGALFLTWKDDDMQCKETEVDKLRQLFASEFNFRTDYFEIPTEKYETALHKRLAEFCFEYDSPEDLAIIYYGGHAYDGKETKQFKLAAKFQNDGHGDPTAFFNDIRTCLRLPACDQLMILDCCFAAKAFAREEIGKRKFELMTSAAHDTESPAPHLPHSFTRTLYKALKRLVKENPKGFCTSHLYREVYHTIPMTEPPMKPNTKPLLFDQARHSFGKIWLRPQVLDDRSKTTEEGRHLKLTFRLSDNPDLAVMNELALHLQFLPHVDRITFEDLYAPKEQIANFMQSIIQAQRLKPLIRKMQARRQLRKVLELKTVNNGFNPPTSLLKLHLEHNHPPAYDWSGAFHDHSHRPNEPEQLRNNRNRKTGTWPSAEGKHLENGSLSDSQPSSDSIVDVPGPGTLVTKFVPRRVNTMDYSLLQETAASKVASAETDQQNGARRKRQRSASPDPEPIPDKKTQKVD